MSSVNQRNGVLGVGVGINQIPHELVDGAVAGARQLSGNSAKHANTVGEHIFPSQLHQSALFLGSDFFGHFGRVS